MLMIVLDGSIVTVALPAIQGDLGFSPADLTWTVNAYIIAFGGLLLLAGRLGDLIGRKRMLIAGLALFTAASLLCGVSTGQEMLIAARFVQGIGGTLASGLFNTTQQVGGALGGAVLSTLATARTEGLLTDGHSTASAMTGGFHLAFGSERA
jgi:MFS family permease